MARRRAPLTRQRDNRFKKLRSMRCYEEVYSRICSGWAMTEVARFIQEERKEYTEISRNGLVQQLTEFRKTVPAGHLVQKRFPEVFDEAKEKVEKGVDELAELEELYRLQMHRVGLDFAVEKSIKKLMPSMTAEIREARQLLQAIAELKMELGVSSRASRSVDVDVNVEVEGELPGGIAGQFGSDAVQKVLGDPESRRKVMGVVERFMRLPAATSPDEKN